MKRHHEMQLGKDWIGRAKLDKENFQKFCQGLERIDNACLQSDETLMLLKDFKL